jgi:hypothetical protein
MKTPREIVIQHYPTAHAENVGKGAKNYYHIYRGTYMLGQGKSAKSAWKAAYNNLDR